MSRLGAQPHHAAVVARPRRRVNRIELLFAAVHESVHVQVFGRRQWRDYRRAQSAGVRKAPRQEIAGCGAPTVQRALWGFGAGVSVGEVASTLLIGSL